MHPHPGTSDTPRTVKRNGVQNALDAGRLRVLPTHGLRPLKVVVVVPRRGLLTPAAVGALLEASKVAGRNAGMRHDYLRFLTCPGVREKDALRVPWSDIDFADQFLDLKISKNRETRRIDFDRNLAALLEEMNTRRFPDDELLVSLAAQRRPGRPRRQLPRCLTATSTTNSAEEGCPASKSASVPPITEMSGTGTKSRLVLNASSSVGAR